MLLTTEWLQELYTDAVSHVRSWTTAERKEWLNKHSVPYSEKKRTNVKNISTWLIEQEVRDVLFSVRNEDFSQLTVEFRRAWAGVEKEYGLV